MNNHKATPEQWDKVEEWCSEVSSRDSCILELRARVMALEAQASSREVAEPAPVAGGLVDRVTLAIDKAPFDENEHQWDEARAALLVVAKWLRERHRNDVPDMLEYEVGR